MYWLLAHLQVRLLVTKLASLKLRTELLLEERLGAEASEIIWLGKQLADRAMALDELSRSLLLRQWCSYSENLRSYVTTASAEATIQYKLDLLGNALKILANVRADPADSEKRRQGRPPMQPLLNELMDDLVSTWEDFFEGKPVSKGSTVSRTMPFIEATMLSIRLKARVYLVAADGNTLLNEAAPHLFELEPNEYRDQIRRSLRRAVDRKLTMRRKIGDPDRA